MGILAEMTWWLEDTPSKEEHVLQVKTQFIYFLLMSM